MPEIVRFLAFPNRYFSSPRSAKSPQLYRSPFGTKKENIVGFYRKEDPANFVKKVMSSPAVHLMSQRRVNVPSDCYSCRHYKECQGGCMRDAELYGRGLGGKFYYCESWKMVFDRIKSSILSGEADNLLKEMGKDVDAIKAHVYSYNQEIE